MSEGREFLVDRDILAQRWTPGADRYSAVAIAFHWAMAALIVLAGLLGLLHDAWAKNAQAFWINIHALVGSLVFLLACGRLWWRLGHSPPPLAPGSDPFSRRLSASVHVLLYALAFVIPLFGIVTFIWHGRVFDFGLFRIDPGVKSTRAIFHPTQNIHGYLAYALFALAGLHILAALWHHVVLRDGVLRRMWPLGSSAYRAGRR